MFLQSFLFLIWQNFSFVVLFGGLFGCLLAFSYPPVGLTTTSPSVLASCFLHVCKEKDLFAGIKNKEKDSGNDTLNR